MARIRHTGPVGSILTAKSGGSAGEAPDFVGATSAQATSSNNLVLALPSGWAPDDIFVGFIIDPDQGGNSLNVLPSQWISLGQYSSGGAVLQAATIFCKKAKAGDTTLTIPTASSNSRSGVLAAYRTARPFRFEMDQLPQPLFQVPSIPGAITTPSTIATRTSRLLVTSVCETTFGDTSVPAPPAGMTQRVNHLYSGFHRHYLFDGVVNKGEDASKVVQWSSPSNSNKTVTVALLI